MTPHDATSASAPAAAIACPNCRAPMQSERLERHDAGTVRVDLCFGCAGIWFDHLASVQLAPGAVIALFKEIYAHRSDARKARDAHLNCPRCEGVLVQSFDLGKTGRFSYFRCTAGDGRFTPFFQFLREKQFIRTLNAVELQHVRTEIRQITCSECGAPIDLENSTECKFCHAPVSFLDAAAVEKAIKLWSAADERRHLAPTPEALGNALLALQLHHEGSPAASSGGLSERFFTGAVGEPMSGARLGIDLVAAGIHAIGHLFDPP